MVAGLPEADREEVLHSYMPGKTLARKWMEINKCFSIAPYMYVAEMKAINEEDTSNEIVMQILHELIDECERT